MQPQDFRDLFDRDWDKLKVNIKFAATYKEKWTSLVPLFEQISAQHAVFVMVWNVITSRIIYVVDKKNVIGHDPAKYLAENWVEFTFTNIHPKFTSAIVLMQQKGTKYFLEEYTGKPENFIINFDFLYKRSTGEYFHFLQQTVCIEQDSEGNPFLILSYVHDITYLKKDGTANLVFTTTDEMKWWNFNFDKNCLETVQPLSKQEKKILSLLAEGKSSKEIANELSLSSHTIDTHRRHLLDKTNCIDTTGMITYARLVGLI